MTTVQITKAFELESKRVGIKHQTASAIRSVLDDARKQYGADEWDDDDVESKVLELVTEDP